MNFDLVLPSTVTRNYKPNAKTYQLVINAFELEEGQSLAFVSAHVNDLTSAGTQCVLFRHFRSMQDFSH